VHIVIILKIKYNDNINATTDETQYNNIIHIIIIILLGIVYKTKRAESNLVGGGGAAVYCASIRVFSYGILAAIVSATRPPADAPTATSVRTGLLKHLILLNSKSLFFFHPCSLPITYPVFVLGRRGMRKSRAPHPPRPQHHHPPTHTHICKVATLCSIVVIILYMRML